MDLPAHLEPAAVCAIALADPFEGEPAEQIGPPMPDVYEEDGWVLRPDLARLVMQGRQIALVWDSDIDTNENVLMAATAFGTFSLAGAGVKLIPSYASDVGSISAGYARCRESIPAVERVLSWLATAAS